MQKKIIFDKQYAGGIKYVVLTAKFHFGRNLSKTGDMCVISQGYPYVGHRNNRRPNSSLTLIHGLEQKVNLRSFP